MKIQAAPVVTSTPEETTSSDNNDTTNTTEGEEQPEQTSAPAEEQEQQKPTDTSAEEAFQLPEKLASAYAALEKALQLIEAGSYESSAKYAAKAVKEFNGVSLKPLCHTLISFTPPTRQLGSRREVRRRRANDRLRCEYPFQINLQITALAVGPMAISRGNALTSGAYR